MSAIPTKTLKALYEKSCKQPNIQHAKAHFEIFNCSDFIQLTHYGTLIFRYWFNGYYETGGAYSITDSRYINGMCILLDIPRIARMVNHKLIIDPCTAEKPKTNYIL